MNTINVNDAGYMTNPEQWTTAIMHELAEKDDMKLTSEHEMYILEARKVFLETGAVPSIRVFAKSFGMDRKAKPLYELFESGVMKRISKWGGMPQPTGCI